MPSTNHWVWSSTANGVPWRSMLPLCAAFGASHVPAKPYDAGAVFVAPFHVPLRALVSASLGNRNLFASRGSTCSRRCCKCNVANIDEQSARIDSQRAIVARGCHEQKKSSGRKKKSKQKNAKRTFGCFGQCRNWMCSECWAARDTRHCCDRAIPPRSRRAR